jgi:hypothetical protein
VNITAEGLSYAREDLSGMPASIPEACADRAVADRFLNSFVRI